MIPFEDLRQEAWEANMLLPSLNLVKFTFGNVSAADHSRGIFAIKPSGVPYIFLLSKDMVIVDFEGNVIDGNMRPSSDTLTHALLYKNWANVSGIAHTHSTYATAWAQSLRDIPVLGTTHADHTVNDIPCAKLMTDEMIQGNYEHETGFQILNCLKEKNINYTETEMILVGSHAPFTWAKTAEKAVYNSAILEEIAQMAFITEQLKSAPPRLKDSLIQKHFQRKHGADSYYGQ